MTTNTDPVRALIEKWRRQAVEHGTRTFTGNDHALFANELEAAIASAPPGAPSDDLSPLLDSLMRAAFDDGDRGREKFSGATMAAREAVLAHVRAASAPPSAAVGVSAEDRVVLMRLKDALPDVGINGWIDGVRVIERILAQQPAAPSGEAVGLPNDLRWKLDNLRPGASGVVTLNREEWDCVRAMFTAPQQPAGVDEAPTWSRQQPTAPGIYGIRGFNLCRPASEQFEAVVVVREHGGELVCNLHESTSEDDLESWAPICDLDPDFEWRVFVPGWQQQGGA